ncbi:tetratricopeptide repeat protein [Lysinibacillus fusiformis]|uniref:tetratricopeptide repeat protein n=1 Tax=Lysinibacillus fusiformis TaxID=28031 RepID=UPI00215A3A51|nr:hypothetical protein [Lysinibacillus fusiformis]MCR8855641.1 hypothetical protein [Lysinibacillus fusiformis]WKT77653.1 hypothetical protein QYY55_02325 [Lysinibacillus fusiformis]
MTFTESIRKYILSGIVTLVVVGLIVATVLASKQDEEFLMSETLYNQAIQLQTDGDLEGSIAMLSEVLKKQPNSEVGNYVAGLINARNGDMKQASIYMQKALDINPYKVEDPKFMLQMGEIFLGAEKFEEARIVLLRCQEAQWTLEDIPDYQEYVTSLLARVENSQSKEGTDNE